MKKIALFSCLLLVTHAYLQAQSKNKSSSPNIIFIVADDLGYGNISSFNANSKVATPNIDALASQGTKFTHFYAGNTVCAPSRCALMTGKHMGHAYVRGNKAVPLRAQDTTIAERLKANGYVTGMFGKWGLGEANQTGSPELKGFDNFFGYLNQTHAHDYFTDHLVEISKGQVKDVKVDTTQYSEDLIMDHALAFLQENKNKPFFLYLPLTLPHAELKVPDNLMKPFLNADGSSKFQPETPYINKGGTYSTQQMPHAAFAAMVTKLDTDVGRVVALVKQLGLGDNTYIFFTSDNGPHKEGGADPDYFNSSGPFRGIKRDLYEGGIRVPMIAYAPGKVPAGKTNDVAWAFWDIPNTLCQLTNTNVPVNTDGISFATSVHGKSQPKQHDYFYWQFNETELREAILENDWKLIRLKSKGKPEVLELYNLKSDIAERNNLAATNPGKVKALRELMLKAKTPSESPAFDWSDMEN
ncbi:MAG: arylsulfatase [Chitinophagaceae bacterium]